MVLTHTFFANTAPGRRWVWLDVWRVVAASLVFLTHYKPVEGRWHALADEGHIGVALFFVLSGALLGTQLWEKAPETGLPTERGWWKGFYLRRFSKIYVLHTVLYLASLPFLLPGSGYILLNLTLTKSLYPPALFSGLPQSWSLTPELMLYALLPFLALLGRGWRTLPWLVAFATAMVAAGIWPYAALYTAAGRGFAFVLGLDLARRWAKTPTEEPGTGYRLGAAVLALLGLAGLMLYLGTLAPPGPHTASTDSGDPQALMTNVIWVPLFFATAVHATRRLTTRETSGAKPAYGALQGLFFLFSQASYAFYLLHVGPLAAGVYLIAGHNNVLTFGLLWILSIGLHLTVERPILRMILAKTRFS